MYSFLLVSVLLCWCSRQLSGKIHFHEDLGIAKPQLHRELAGPGWRAARVPPLQKPGRFKRAGVTLAENGDQLSVDVTRLNDTRHNEAIVHWSGEKSNVVFVLTREHFPNGSVPDSTLYRSKDYGSTFEKLKSVPSEAVLRYYFSCPSNKSKLVFTDVRAHKLYVTHDDGDTMDAFALPFPPEHLVFHPHKQDWILGYTYQDRKLYMSDDLGKTWDEVAQYVNKRFYWAVEGVDKEDSTVHMELQDPTSGEYHYRACAAPYMDCKKEMTVSPDFGPIDVDSLIVQNEYIFVQRSTQFTSHLYVSYNRGPLQQAFFPFTVHPQDFSIVNTAEHQVFIAADHRDKTVNLYLSDKTGRFYIKSLQRVVALRRQNGGFDTDLYQVRGVNGTYIVNQHTDGNPKTLISFDQGGEWKPLKAPTLTLDNHPTNCEEPNCGLHLHLGFSRTVFGVPFILSEDNAPGLVMAHGNIGGELAPHNATLFISSDAGYTWRALFKGNFNYNILDQGGAIVVVADSSRDKTNTILYSCTEGRNWTKHTFLSDEIQVDGVLNEPGITTLIASIYGHLDRDSGWVIAKVNFHSILRRKCGPEDYHLWDPIEDEPYCILGQRYKYKHRNQTARCYNGDDYEKAINITICSCVAEDFECDFGYERTEDGSCKKSPWFNADIPIFKCPEGTYYNHSSGYRKIAADKCEDGVETEETFSPRRTLCPLMAPDGLRLTTATHRQTIPTGTKITFKLSQDKGSTKSTEYIYSFGEKIGATTRIKGLAMAKIRNHTYMEQGTYHVTVTAKNQKGTATVALDLRVADALRGVYISNPHAARIHKPVKFEAIPVTANLSGSALNNVHFLWLFGDEETSQHPMLTYEHQVTHTYKKEGTYTVALEVVNSVSSIFKRFIVPVYSTLATVQVLFSSEVDDIAKHTAMWRQLFGDLLKRALVEELNIDPRRLEVFVWPGRPTKADVSVLPPQAPAEESITQLVSRLISKVHSEEPILVKLSPNDFGEGAVKITDAYIISDDPEPKHRKEPNRVALIIFIPILLVTVIILGALFFLYHRRRSSLLRRYAVLQSHSRAENEDDLLGSVADEDDDPPLSPDPDYDTTHRRHGDDNGLHAFGL